MILSDINNKKEVTAKIRIQGGIVAANGFTGIFMVHSVSAVGNTKKVSRDGNGSGTGYNGREASPHTFSKILEAELKEKEAPAECRTVTYGRDLHLRTFLYQTHEYQY